MDPFKTVVVILAIVIGGAILLSLMWNFDQVRAFFAACARAMPKMVTYRSGHGRHSLTNHQASRA